MNMIFGYDALKQYFRSFPTGRTFLFRFALFLHPQFIKISDLS